MQGSMRSMWPIRATSTSLYFIEDGVRVPHGDRCVIPASNCSTSVHPPPISWPLR